MGEDVCHTKEECEQLYQSIDPELRKRAAEYLFGKMMAADVLRIKGLIEQYGHDEWLWHLYDEEISKLSEEERARGYAAIYSPHFGFGMAVRNSLRKGGFGEEELGVHNLDDVYVNIIEEAMRG